jgi:hypothetical protein
MCSSTYVYPERAGNVIITVGSVGPMLSQEVPWISMVTTPLGLQSLFTQNVFVAGLPVVPGGTGPNVRAS